MELSPKLYHLLVRPDWFTDFLIKHIAVHNLNFKNKNVLDFGCGIGSNTPLFSSANYLGLDSNPKRVRYARRLHPEYTFHVTKNNRQLPVEDGAFDCVFISSVLHHIPTGDIGFYLREFQRILNPKGSVIVIEPCFFKGSHLANSFMTCMDRGKYIRTEKEYIDLFHKSNYKTEILNRFNEFIFYNKLFFTAKPQQ